MAYRNPEATTGRGRPKKYGVKVKLKELFADRSKFRRATVIGYGCMQYLSTYFPLEVYAHAPWLRTKTLSGHPSEETVAAALRSSLSEFLVRSAKAHPLRKILLPFQRRSHAPRIAA